MNTLSYFLSTLRPTPPPSPRASTSQLPLEAQHSRRLPSTRTGDPSGTPSPLSEGALDLTLNDVLDTDGESTEGGEDRSRRTTRRDGASDDPSRDGDHNSTRRLVLTGGDPPRIATAPSPPSVSRKGSRKGKAKLEDSERDPLVEKHTHLPSAITSTTVTLSTADAPIPQSWPFAARLARTWPFRFTASIYLLIRRFLSLFGLSYPPRPHYNSLLSPSKSDLDPEKSQVAVRRSTIVSLSLRSRPTAITNTPPPSVPPNPSIASLDSKTQTIPRPIRAPPRLTPKTLVLDLDETLIHSTSRPTSGRNGRRPVPKGLKTTMVEVVLDGRSTMYTVYKRPWVDFFLRKVSSWYTVIIFTASLPEYADPVIDWLDGGDGRGGLIGGRLFRSHCLAKNGTYMKDLTVVDPDLARVCLVDNSPVSYAINQANGIPIEGWINDPNDECLLDLLPMLDSLRFTNDVRRVLGLRGFGKSASAPSASSRQTMSPLSTSPSNSSLGARRGSPTMTPVSAGSTRTGTRDGKLY